MEIPGYRIERLIAEGGMASVYLAVQESLGRHVALKLLRKFDSPEQAQRFMDEGRIIAGINHRNVITIHDIGMVDDRPYLSMEYLEGGSLEQRIREGMSVEEALDLLEKIGNCLDAVHSRGVVHRDIKPENILFHEDGTPILTDFGIATQLAYDPKRTLDGTALGSPFYLSPEQAESKAVDGRTDIYGLGIIFYEMLMGRRPYQADSYIHTILAHIADPIPTFPRELRKYQGLLDSMIAKHPADRFSSAQELVERVRELRRSGLGPLAKRKTSEYVEGWGHAADAPDEAKPSRRLGRSTSEHGATLLKDADAETLLRSLLQRPAPKPPAAWVLGAATAVAALLTAGVAALLLRTAASPPMPVSPSAPAPSNSGPPTPGGDAGTGALASQPPDALAPSIPELPRPESASDPTALMPPTLAALPAPASLTGAAETLPGALQAPGIGTRTAAADPDATPAAAVPADAPAAPQPTREAQIEGLLASAREALAGYRLTTPSQDSALHYYREVLELDPKQSEARNGVSRIAERYAVLADDAMTKADYKKADLYLQRGLSVQPDNRHLVEAERRLVKIEQAKARAARERAPVEDRTEPQHKPHRGFLETLKAIFR